METSGKDARGNGKNPNPKKPEFSKRIGAVEVACWLKHNASGAQWGSVKLTKGVKPDPNGPWQQSQYLNTNDLQRAIQLLNEVYEWAAQIDPAMVEPRSWKPKDGPKIATRPPVKAEDSDDTDDWPDL